MPRLFCPGENISAQAISISDKQGVHYIKDVLRARRREELVFFDESGKEYVTEIEKVSSRRILCRIKRKQQAGSSRQVRLAVACAIAKNARMDDIVDKLTQLGADKIIPMLTERVIVKLDPHKESLRLARWNKIAKSALQQSHGVGLPEIAPVKNIEEVLREAEGYDLKLIPTLGAGLKSLKEALSGSKAKNILVLIGPEGDFSGAEVALAKKRGFIPVALGERVLRVDTAAIAAASFIRLNE